MRKLASLLVLSYFISSLIGCGGGGGGSSSSPPRVVESPASVVGVFSAEQPIAKGEVTLKDADGTVVTTVTDANGLYYFDTSQLKPPFVIKGSYTIASVTYDFYTYVSGTFSSTDNVNANINEFTTVAATLLVAKSDNGRDPDKLFTETNTNRINMLNTDISAELKTFEDYVCGVVISDDQLNYVGCGINQEENFVIMPYSTDPAVNNVEKMNQLLDIEYDDITDCWNIKDRSGTVIIVLPVQDVLDGNLDPATMPLDTAIQVNNTAGTTEQKASLENESTTVQLSSSDTTEGVVDYDPNFPMAQITVDNLTECPIEIRNFKVTLGDNSSADPMPYVGYPDPINPLSIDTSPTLKMNTPVASVHPVDACRSFKFDYEFEYNFVIRKQEKEVLGGNGETVWEYDVPACEKYTNKTVEEYYQSIAVAPDAFSNPAIEVRPELNRFSASWPDSSVTFVFAQDCPLVAEFSVTPTEGTTPLTVNVDASNSVGNITSFEWSTSTGVTSTGLSDSFTFDTAGNHSITLTVTDTNGKTETVTKTIVVDALPQAAFTWATGDASFKIDLDASGSTGASLSSYQWSTSDGQTATGQTTSFTFASAGDYSVTLTITDKYGNTSEVTKIVTAEEITAIAVDDNIVISGEIDWTTTPYFTFDILANDIGNVGDILTINGNGYGFNPGGAYVKIAADKKSVYYEPSFLFYNTGIEDEAMEFSFTYTAENLDTGGTITGNVTVDINPTLITRVSAPWKYVYEVTTGIHPDFGYNVPMINGVMTTYLAEDKDTGNWLFQRTTEYTNGLRNGMDSHHVWGSDPDTGYATYRVSTCATQVKEYANDVAIKFWNYYASWSLSGTPCSLSSSGVY